MTQNDTEDTEWHRMTQKDTEWHRIFKKIFYVYKPENNMVLWKFGNIKTNTKNLKYYHFMMIGVHCKYLRGE